MQRAEARDDVIIRNDVWIPIYLYPSRHPFGNVNKDRETFFLLKFLTVPASFAASSADVALPSQSTVPSELAIYHEKQTHALVIDM